MYFKKKKQKLSKNSYFKFQEKKIKIKYYIIKIMNN